MDINNIINDIENMGDISDRCICYSEVIIHLRNIKSTYYFIESPVAWKNDINEKILKVLNDTVDEKILEMKKMIKLNVEINKLV